MIPLADLRKIARARLQDAEALLTTRRYDGAVYLCGYAVEVALKARICRTLKWAGYPSTRKEFEGYQSFRVHDLDVLLHLSGAEAKIKSNYLAAWLAVAAWDPSVRYAVIGSSSAADAQHLIESVRIIIGEL